MIRIRDSRFIGNTALRSGGSVYIDKSANGVHMIGCSVADSLAAVAG